MPLDDDHQAIDTAYLSASGSSFDDCAFLGQRYLRRRGYREGESEMWVLRTSAAGAAGTSISMHHPTDTQYSGLWRSPAGVTFVTDASMRCVRVDPTLGREAVETWDTTPLPFSPYGVWGLDEGFVIAWGVCAHGAGAALTYPMARFDGNAWSPIADPGFEVYAIHGSARDTLVAVGALGQVARFDGGAWRSFPTPVSETLTGVFVVSADESYVTGNSGALLEGGPGGFGVIAQTEGNGNFPLLSVAWWHGALWIAGGVLGLLRRVGRSNVLEVVKPNIAAIALDARRDLVMTTRDAVVGTSDGARFFGTGRDKLGKTCADRPLHFYR